MKRVGPYAAIALLAAAASAPAVHADLTDQPLPKAVPEVVKLTPRPAKTPIRLADGLRDWHGRLSHLAGTSHYDRGEWIYEDYPWSAYGAAPIGEAEAQQALAGLGDVLPQGQRLPGGLTEAQATSGAGPMVDDADVSDLRIAVRRKGVYVLARTTTMRAPVRTALLMLFDTGQSTGPHDVPFGSGLHSESADVVALVTAAGTRVINLNTGATTTASAAADPSGYDNTLTARLPLSAVAAPGGTLRLVAASGLVAPGSLTLDPGGPAGPLAKVVPRSEPGGQAVYERAQSLALAAHDIDSFFSTISLRRLRHGYSERLYPGRGYNVRTMTAPEARSKAEAGTDGTLRDYGLYIPQSFVGRPSAATLLLRGSGMTAHGLPAITPGLVRQLGDDNGAIVVSPSGRSGFDDFSGAAYLDAEQALNDAQRLLPIDPDRISVAGYSMGGYATYMFAATQPDLFSAAFVIEGPVGGAQPATKSPIVDAFPDVIPSLANLALTPIEIYQGEHDADVPISNGLAASQRLRDLGYRYRLNVFPGDHFTPGVLDDYRTGASYLKDRRRDAHPSEVRFSRDMTFEHAIDTGATTDAPLAGQSVGLHFDHAWYVRDLTPADLQAGNATIDVRTLARPSSQPTPVRTLGTDPGGGVGGAPPSLYDEQEWQLQPSATAPSNAFDMTLTGAAHVRLDLASMGLRVSRPLGGMIDTNHPVTITLTLPRRACVSGSLDGGATRSTRRARRTYTVALPAGEHQLRLLRRTSSKATPGCAVE